MWALAVLAVARAAGGPDAAGLSDFSALAPPTETSSITGPLGDVTCDVEAVDRANEAQLSTLLDEVMNTTFFSLFKTDLDRKCQFWSKDDDTDGDDSHDDTEAKCGTTLPVFSTGASDPFTTAAPKAKSACALDSDSGASGMSLPWSERSDPVTKGFVPETSMPKETDNCELPAFWLDMCTDIPTDSDEKKAEYTNLQVNPERWTGYNGSHIWAAIYSENCFSRTENLVDMCYEERVLYRLLSGMHASINVHIALNYFPPRTGKRSAWESNPARYDQLFKNEPDRLRNLHFAFVVTLRALRKATPFLYNYSYEVGDPIEDIRSQKLVRRLLDTHIMSSCSDIFTAFDESLMFGSQDEPSTVATLKHNFKGVFRNISRIMDCVTCQKCKLHGKLILLGVGTALKVLLLPEDMVGGALSREEIVALVNTIGKLSQAIVGVKTLTKKSWEQQYFDATGKLAKQREADARLKQAAAQAAEEAAREVSRRTIASLTEPPRLSPLQKDELADVAVGLVDSLAASKLITVSQEDALVTRALDREANILILAKRYRTNPQKFLKFALKVSQHVVSTTADRPVDVVIIGAGLAGLTATLNLVDRGGKVVLVDKNKFTGGNSAYASSGINAVGEGATGDSVVQYLDDTIRSSGRNMSASDDTLAGVLVRRSFKALDWFRRRVGMPLDIKGQLGGHSAPRTYRPATGMAGSEMVFAITKLVKAYAKANPDKLELKLGARLESVSSGSDGSISGVQILTATGDSVSISTKNVLLATGGFSSDNSGSDSMLGRYRPDLLRYATTNGLFSTGDGHKVAMAAGARLVDMDQVQVHPTAFVGDAGKGQRLVLCAEILRGEGAILLDRAGNRFADELGKRDYLTGKINEVLGTDDGVTLLLPEAGAKVASKHVPHYMGKGLLTKLETVEDVATWMNISESALRQTLEKYKADAMRGTDDFGKKFFHHANFIDNAGPFYAGKVTPAVHYTLGGISVDTAGRVLKEDGSIFNGLFAAGEVTGGVHGVNRLGGNALTEAVVFGQLVSESIRLGEEHNSENSIQQHDAQSSPTDATSADVEVSLREIQGNELKEHDSRPNCWIAVGGKVYDFTDFVDEHPGGVETITDNCGFESTEVFDAVHTRAMLDDFDPIGSYSE